MTQILTRDTDETAIRAHGGGKVLNLYRLTRAGFDVPPWAALGTDVFRRHRRESGIDSEQQSLLERVEAVAAAAVAAEIQALIAEAEPDTETVAAIHEAYATIGAGAVAVRSSGAEEDRSELSFAGQFASFLNVMTAEEVVEAVQRCWASAFSERALTYRARHGLLGADVDVAVAVQRMVPAETSGVLFTANPSTGDRGQLVVSAVSGLGDRLVSGQVSGETVVVERATESVLEGGGDGLAGDHATLAELIRVATRVEEALEGPQDIEWAVADGRVWLLQSRPITGLAPAGARAQVWDKSSVSENFGDVTTPLTFSFVQHVTYEIYREHFRLLWIPYRELHQMEGWLRSMFGYFNGRMYNQLSNWVRTNRLLPFAALRRRVMQMQMGLAEPIDEELIAEAEPFACDSRLRAAAIRAVVRVRFAWRFATVGLAVRRFLRRFDRLYGDADHVDYRAPSSDEVYARLRSLEKGLIREFGSVLFLHPAISLAVGTLGSLTRRWLPDAPEWFHWKAASPKGDVVTAEPARRLVELAELARRRPAVAEILRTTPREQARDRLEQAGEPEFLRAVAAYVDDFGYRSVNELKFEESSIREDSSQLFAMLADNLAAGATVRAAASDDDASDTDAYLRAHLRGPRRLVYKAVRWRARRLLRAREHVRFRRTRAFGVTRTMFLAMGEDLARVGALDEPRDIFHLRLDEIRGCFEAGVHPGELKPAVALRKESERRYRDLAPPRRFVTRGPVYWSNGVDEGAWAARAHVRGEPGQALSGVPCSPGVAEGEARVMAGPNDARGGIVATYRTDPGWVTVLPSAAALLVEVGSPLNHVAIVARELGVPTVVQIDNLTTRLATGMRLRVDGGRGEIQITGGPEGAVPPATPTPAEEEHAIPATG